MERLLLTPALEAPEKRFVVAGPQYPQDIVWPANVERIEHLPPCEHATFYSASRLTLNVTRADMIEVGWSPSVRLFEAAACGTAIVSDIWEGLAAIFEPGREILLARGSPDIALGSRTRRSIRDRASRPRPRPRIACVAPAMSGARGASDRGAPFVDQPIQLGPEWAPFEDTSRTRNLSMRPASAMAERAEP